ncbi:hypothetical protein [Nocardia sp. NPDC004711]
MAVLSVMEWVGNSPTFYVAIIERMGVQNAPAEGILLHIAGETATGMRIVEVWDDEDAFEAFVRERLLPAAEDVGLTTEPAYTVTAVANLFAPTFDPLRELADGFAAVAAAQE